MLFKLYMLSVMKDERKGAMASFCRAILSFLSFFYGIGIRLVAFGYRSGIRRIHKVSVPVISVGNITLGGTGKTPFAIFLADKVLSLGRKPAILIRGYGKDENKMLADERPDVPVISGQDRVKSAERSVSEGRNLLILDDGFQHRRLGRDLEVVLIDGNSFKGENYIFPRGILREPETSLERADIIVITRADMISSPDREEIKARFNRLFPDKPLVQARYKAASFSDVKEQTYPADFIKGKNVILVSGIGSPDQFSFMVKELGGIIKEEVIYPDHHKYSGLDISDIKRKLGDAADNYIIVTRKDMVKLREMDISSIEDRIMVLNISVDILEGGSDINAGLDRIIAG